VERYNVTSVVISHDMASVFRIADRIAMLHQKKILAAGTPAEIKQYPNEYLQEFITASLVTSREAM
jgi:ABC-type transporter Mla maintaining outer membrane lipid asymmetry ATPase subunit MlaF